MVKVKFSICIIIAVRWMTLKDFGQRASVDIDTRCLLSVRRYCQKVLWSLSVPELRGWKRDNTQGIVAKATEGYVKREQKKRA